MGRDVFDWDGKRAHPISELDGHGVVLGLAVTTVLSSFVLPVLRGFQAEM
jgi:hypothetical protein